MIDYPFSKPVPSLQTLIGFDVGMRRTGVAVGQCLTWSAQPLKILLSPQGQIADREITQLITEWQPSAFVIGYPLQADGSMTMVTPKVIQLAEQLADHAPVYACDEYLSSHAAREYIEEHQLKRSAKQPIDDIAACIILQSWFSDYRLSQSQ